MGYLQALADLYRDGILPRGVRVRPDLLEMILKERQSMIEDGFRLWIEPQGAPIETIQPLENGKRLITYKLTTVYAFEKDGKFYPDPSSVPFEEKRQAIDRGEIFFLVDAASMIIGFGDSMTGNSYGEQVKRKISLMPLILMAIILLASFLLRVLH